MNLGAMRAVDWMMFDYIGESKAAELQRRFGVLTGGCAVLD